MVYLINTAEQDRSVEMGLFSTVKKFLTVNILPCSTEETDIQFLNVSIVETTESAKICFSKYLKH